MVKSKYIFETSETRTKRRILFSLNVVLVSIFIYSLFCVIFVLESKHQNTNTDEALFNRRPDLIVVFTGDVGRIPYALELAKKYQQPNVFISGVHEKNTVETLISNYRHSGNIDFNFLKIDYLPKNTVENVIFTLRYLRENPGFKKVLLISNDYHISRINLITSRFVTEDDKFQFFYYGINTDYKSFRNLKILYKEVYKLIRTYLFLLLWNY